MNININKIDKLIRSAIKEDMPEGDVTTLALIKSSHRTRAVLFTKQDVVICGLDIAKRVFELMDRNIRVRLLAKDGQKLKKNTKVLLVEGRTQSLLSAERTALNFLSYLSAIATKTDQYVREVHPYKARVMDTRKTSPTLRFVERYAVRCGGGYNHRDHLSHMAMIKDNHLLCISGRSIKDAVHAVKKKANIDVEVEVDTLIQFRDALESGADIIMLDNMSPAQIHKAVQLRNKFKKNILLEVSGGVKLGNIKQYAQAGVDRISVGALTHSREAIDFSMEIIS